MFHFTSNNCQPCLIHNVEQSKPFRSRYMYKYVSGELHLMSKQQKQGLRNSYSTFSFVMQANCIVTHTSLMQVFYHQHWVCMWLPIKKLKASTPTNPSLFTNYVAICSQQTKWSIRTLITEGRVAYLHYQKKHAESNFRKYHTSPRIIDGKPIT